jgi:hypothetical protein
MAKARDLAALAGLAGLAYAMRNKDNKDKGMTPEQNDDLATANRVSKMSEDSDTLARVNRNMSAGQSAADDTNAGVLKALATPKTAPNDQAGNQGVLSPKSSGKSAAEAVAPTNPMSSAAKRSDQLANVSRAVKREAKTKQFADDVPYQESAQKTDALMVASRAARAADARRRMAKQSAYKSGGMTSSASNRADGIATKGKTRGKIC